MQILSLKRVQEHIHDSVEQTIISQVGRSQRAQYPVVQPRKQGLKTQTVNKGFSSITLQSVFVLKGTKKPTIDSIELTIITKLRRVIELNNSTQCKKTLENWRQL